jgi:hypothetical protein
MNLVSDSVDYYLVAVYSTDPISENSSGFGIRGILYLATERIIPPVRAYASMHEYI